VSLPALLYARASAADEEGTLAARLAAVRAVAAARQWPVAQEFQDRDRGSSISGRRNGLSALTAAVRQAERPAVVVCASLPNLFRSMRHLANFGAELAERGFELVAIKESIDTTDVHGRLCWLEFIGILAAFDRARRSEASRAARALASTRAAATWGRPLVAVNPHELVSLWHGYKGQHPLSEHELARKLGVSRRTIGHRLEELRAAGKLDIALREKNLAARGGLRKGGRPVRKGKR
jgi:DNA invertase Pin-like site-specific DNA recombinase